MARRKERKIVRDVSKNCQITANDIINGVTKTLSITFDEQVFEFVVQGKLP